MLSLAWLMMFSCESKKKEINTSNSLEFDIDTFVQDIPREKNGDFDFAYRTKDTIEKRVGLIDLSKGYDSVFIRLYYSYSLSEISQMVEIFYDKKIESWQSKIHTLLFEYSTNGDSLINVKDSVVQASPKSGWQVMMKKLNSFDMIDLPDCSMLENYALPMDGDGVMVQVATNKKYRMYSYTMPVLYKNLIPEAKKMYKILYVIQDELGFKQIGEM